MASSRVLKKEIRYLLSDTRRQEALAVIFEHRPRRIINALIACFYESDALIRWRGIKAAGALVADLAESDRESARVVMRRLMWMLNDESGGIGWGAPEAMGEITALSRAMEAEYGDILCSFIHSDRNFIEHPGLQRGVLWGVGRLALSAPGRVKAFLPGIVSFMKSEDPVHRGHAAWAAGNAKDPESLETLEQMFSDNAQIDFFEHWDIRRVKVKELASDAAGKILKTKGQI
ncbi:MAG: HEAT repeat domain-containing protein [Desulfobacteraceae bacterium]|nr:HEAT repeat domain-containing protein [Desulfobacteraceae bacterium]